MKRVSVFIAIFILIFPILGFCKNKEKERIERCIWLVSEIMKEDAPRYLLSHSKGIVIIPGIKKAAFIFGAKRGKGVIVLRKNGKWLPPFFITLSGGSFGLQAGAKSSDILLIVMTERAVDTFRRNKMRLGVDIGIKKKQDFLQKTSIRLTYIVMEKKEEYLLESIFQDLL